MRKTLLFAAMLFIGFGLDAQQLTQTVRGTVLDADSKSPLPGVQVLILNTPQSTGATTDENGNFRLQHVSVGRIDLRLSFIGYESITLPDIEVISGKETIINATLTEAVTQLKEVVITPVHDGETVNEMAVVSARSIFAGVNNSQDGSADIIVRGNSPKFLQWRLEGMEITNPNHFADLSGLGANGFSALNNNVLATSDFYTGAFPAEFGDGLSGVYDVKLRSGNNEKFEGILGIGIIGTDLSLEGPLSKRSSASFLANYRYTTIGLVSKLGLLDEIPGVPHFQDGVFKIVLPTKNVGKFSLFGLTGASSIIFEDVDPFVWVTPNDRGRREDIIEDYEKDASLINTGVNHHLPLNDRTYLFTQVAFSNETIRDRVIETMVDNEIVIHKHDNFVSNVNNDTYRAYVTLNHKANSRNTIQLGSRYSYTQQSFDVREVMNDQGTVEQLADFREGIGMLRNFISWKHRLSTNLSVVSGLHNMNVLFNNSSLIEPRVGLHWQVDKNAFRVGYGKHSAMEAVHHYFANVEAPDGSRSRLNEDLGLLKAHHFVASYERQFGTDVKAKIETYYQYLYDLPVENDPSSSYSTINESLDLRYVDLVNKGTGRNVGVELTLEKFFSRHYYYMMNGSLFESTYKALDGVERNTAFNGNYLINILAGKEFTGWGRKHNQTLTLNGKVFLGGGRRFIPLLRNAQGNLAVDPENNLYYDNSKAYSNALDDIQTVTISVSYMWHKIHATHEVFLNIDNVTDNRPRLGEYYAPEKPDGIGYQTPLGIFPNLMYRLYF
jgi:hypothetical protein